MAVGFDWFEFFSPHIHGLKSGSKQWASGHCPLHEDKRESFALNIQNGCWTCHAGCGKGSAKALCEKLEIDYPLGRRGRSEKERKPGRPSGNHAPAPSSGSKVIATYLYTDEQERPLFRKRRTADKKFWVERPDGKGGWIAGTEGVRIVPYFLHEVIKADRVGIVEGERDVSTLRVLGFTGTTGPFGADRWPEEFAHYFKGKELLIFRDNDRPGRRYQLEVALNCFAVARSVKLIELPGLKEKEDVTDWCNKGHTKEDLLKIIIVTALSNFA